MEKSGTFYRDEMYEKNARKFQYDFDNGSLKLLVNNNLFQLLLTVTEDCNLRCKYCYLTDVYDYTRNRTNANMTFETAKKAIDMFLENISEISKRNPGKKAAITFYGGEPLMNFLLIKECVEYVKLKTKVEILFNTTTNGVLLDGEILDYLIENDFIISVSFDGAKKNHDRNRVFHGNKDSYELIYQRLKNIKHKYPDYQKVKIVSVIDYETDLTANVDFFIKHKGILPDLAMISFVSPTNTRYFEHITPEIFQEYNL